MEDGANLRPGTPQANCSMCEHFEAETGMCEALQQIVKPELLCDLFVAEEGDVKLATQPSLIDRLFGGPSG